VKVAVETDTVEEKEKRGLMVAVCWKLLRELPRLMLSSLQAVTKLLLMPYWSETARFVIAKGPAKSLNVAICAL
jgi:hypothetical protein